jgi:hypothetical protein
MRGIIVSAVLAFTAAGPMLPPDVSVREENGTYFVRAMFDVPETPAIARAVLTDYEGIPRFMSDVKTSVIVERFDGRVLVRQEATSKFTLFSKTIYLLLDISERDSTIRFNDRSGKSFTRYQGTWHFVASGGHTTVTYELAAKPAFSVPGFVIRKLMKSNALEMIADLKREMTARAR